MMIPSLHDDHLIEFLPGLAAHASGALWLPDDRTALVAELHLGTIWTHRRRGQVGTIISGSVEQRLDHLLNELHPEQIIVMGDLVHSTRFSLSERDGVERALNDLQSKTRVVLLRGTHERAFERDFAHLRIPVIGRWNGTVATATHGDRIPDDISEDRMLLMGHWHPTVSICDAAGAIQRLPAFLVYPRFVILPAFSPFAVGFDIGRGLPPELGRWTSGQEAHALAVSGDRVSLLGKLRARARSPRQPRRKARDPLSSSATIADSFAS